MLPMAGLSLNYMTPGMESVAPWSDFSPAFGSLHPTSFQLFHSLFSLRSVFFAASADRTVIDIHGCLCSPAATTTMLLFLAQNYQPTLSGVTLSTKGGRVK
uniref:Protein N-terminal asparagine amidohydrolase n=1 Tax=Mesocestoides corti TaxID=53468 RepID=A0A5K3EJ88_MESCO